MRGHDCPGCIRKGSCPVEKILPWLDGHEKEVLEVKDKSADDVTSLIMALVDKYPIIVLLVNSGDFASVAAMIFELGYYAGRTFPVVPKVYEDA